MKTRLVDRFEDIAGLAADWNELAWKSGVSILDADITASYEWAKTTWEILARDRSSPSVILEDASGIAGILSISVKNQLIHRLPCRRASPLSDLYSGRTGWLLRTLETEALERLLRGLCQLNWDIFDVTLVDGSRSHQLFTQVSERLGVRVETIASQASPYIRLDTSWDNYFAGLPQKFRWNIRQGLKKLKAEGELTYREFGQTSDVNYYMKAMLDIERESWKESTGTSITANEYQQSVYTALCDVACKKHWFNGHLLELNGKPIAYVYGLLFNGTFSDLKESYRHEYREFSPGHVLKTYALPQLIARNTRYFDYMGNCEPYKLRWTRDTYNRTTYRLYNRSLRGRLVALAASAARIARDHRLARAAKEQA